MLKPRKTLAVASAAALTLLAITIPTGSGNAVPPGPTIYSPSGWLTVTIGATNQVGFDLNKDGVPEATQSLAGSNNCLLVTDESLMKFDGFVGTSTTDKASFYQSHIGVAEKTSGTSCGRVSAPGEKLYLALNPAKVKGSVSSLLASSANLDVELKSSARILATAFRDGVAVGYYELQSGNSVGTTSPLPGGVTPNQVFRCTGSTDSGPDAGLADDCRWPISTPSWTGADDGIYFDALTLQPVSGEFSLEGGADGVVLPAPPAGFPQAGNLFELVEPIDGTLTCNAQTETEPGSSTAPEITVTRLDNASPTETCTLIPYTLRNSDSSARFLKPLTSQTTAQFVMTMVWTIPATSSLPLPVTTVDFESPDPRTGIPVGWCPDAQFSGNTLTGIADPLNNAAAPDLDNALSGKQFACLGTQTSKVVQGTVAGSLSDDTVQVTEQIYVLGDVFLRK